jgi:mRNA interferase RelE/StbE
VKYRVDISRTAEKQMRHLTKTIRQRIRIHVNALRDDPYHGASKLVGMPGFRQRVGDYRILYSVDDNQRSVRVTAIKHRREAYR